MLRMDTVHVVRHKVLNEGVSRRQVADELGISRNTVAKYLEVSQPRRVETGARTKRVLSKVAARIDELVAEWGARSTSKQRITGSRLYRQLRDEGYEVGKTTVFDYLREKRRQSAEVFIPLVYRPGEVAQVDFFEVTVEEGGRVRKVWKFLLRLMWSGFDFAWLYSSCDQLAFLDAHVRAFDFLGGVPQRCVYDNLTAAVQRRLGAAPKLSDRFAALASHYLFEPCFARPGEGHDKGGVESRGKNIRFQHLTPIPQGDSLASISETLLADLRASASTRRNARGECVLDLFEREQRVLGSLPEHAFDPRKLEIVSVSSKATVQIAGAVYSVPQHWARLDAAVHIGVDDLLIVCRGEVRSYPKVRAGERVIRYVDYLPELSRKPQAVRQVAPDLVAELGEPWPRLWTLLVETHGGREAGRVLSRLLAVVVKQGPDHVRALLESALTHDGCNLAALSLLVHGYAESVTNPVPAALTHVDIERARSSDYDWLLAGGVQ